MPLSEIAEAAKIEKATARRLLLTLRDAGLVAQDPVSQHYSLSLAVVELGASVPDAVDLRELARPVLTGLARDIGCTAFLSVYQNRSAVCLERLHDDRSITFRWWPVGGSMPLNCGAAPKLLLSFQSQREIDEVLASPLEALTEKSITDPAKLRKRLALIKRRGWEVSADDVMVGLTAIAVPVLDRSQRLMAAISTATLTSQTGPGPKRHRHLGLLIDAAQRLSESVA
jgi:DNA-binding IclR family transcriptional regulator